MYLDSGRLLLVSFHAIDSYIYGSLNVQLPSAYHFFEQE